VRSALASVVVVVVVDDDDHVVVVVVVVSVISGDGDCRYDETGGFVSWRLLLLNLLHFV
jgi:hypothetical protein